MAVNCVAISLTDNPVTHTPLTAVNKASINDIFPETGRNNKTPPIKHKNKKVRGKIRTGDLTASEYIFSINKPYNFLNDFPITHFILSQKVCFFIS